MKLLKWYFVPFVLLSSFSAYAILSWYEGRFTRLPIYGQTRGMGPEGTRIVGSFNLTDQENTIIGTQSWKGKIVVVNFFFTHCPSICPKMTGNLIEVQEKYRDDSSVIINSITVDPETDSTPQLRQYAQRFGIHSGKWQLLTGNKKDIYRLARNEFGVVAADGDGGPDDFIHSDKIVLIDPQRRIRGYYTGTDVQEIRQLVADIKKLQHEL